MQTQRQLVDEFQPNAFSDFVGQEDIVRYLAGLAKAGIIRNMLFTGPAGVGKTTIAKAYAQALNCEAPQSGNACLECSACRNPSFYFREVDTPTLNQTEKDFKKTMMYQLRPFAATTKVGVILFDEAHALMPKSSDMLLNHIVALQQGATDANSQRQAVLFATTDGSKLSPALRSRLTQRSLSSLPPRDLKVLAERIVAGADLKCEEGALWVVAGWSNGCGRNLVNALDQYARDGKWTLAQARQDLGLDHDKALTEYFCALADGEVGRQLIAFEQWRLPERDKLAWMSELIAKIYYRHILKKDAGHDPRMEGIDVKPIIDRFALLFGEHDRLGWRRIIDYWVRHMTPDGGSGILDLISLSEFVGRLATDLAPGATVPDAPAREVLRPGVSSTTSAATVGKNAPSPAAPGHTIRGDLSTLGTEFLNSTDVAAIFNRASFFVQNRGDWFNAVAHYSPVDAADDLVGPPAMQRFCSALEQKGKECRADIPFAQISVVAHFEHRYSVTSLLYLPIGSRTDLQQDWNDFVTRLGGNLTSAPKKAGRAFHFDGLSRVVETLGRSRTLPGDSEPLWKRLALNSKELRDGNLVDGDLVTFSASLAQEHAAAVKSDLPPLSAFDDRAWPYLRKGWEVDECDARKNAMREREALGSQASFPSIYDLPRPWQVWERPR